jgi:hypothetical protein
LFLTIDLGGERKGKEEKDALKGGDWKNWGTRGKTNGDDNPFSS